jgi:hypothetical protein
MIKKKEKPLDTRLRDNLRRRLSKTLKDVPRDKKAHELLGCSWNHFKKHMESQFVGEMSWENYGGDTGWHIDHIFPCMNFDFNKRGQQAKCFHYKNLRPLWGEDNRKRKKRFKLGEEIHD